MAEEKNDPLNGMNADQSKPKEETQNGDPSAYDHQDQRAVDPDKPGATNPDHVEDHRRPAGQEADDSGQNILAGQPGDRDPAVEAKIQKGQERHTSEGNPRNRINPQDSGNRSKV